ncbi:MAG: 3-phosphoshikimate 1-carboxyvinyltransferase [Thermoanaerobaculia bacterium]
MTPHPLSTGRLEGTIRVPGSKSVTNRALLAAALAEGESTLINPLESSDTRALAVALKQLGAEVFFEGAMWRIAGPIRRGGHADPGLELNVGDAGTPARFLAALLPALSGRFVLDGSSRMRERPMEPLLSVLRSLGAQIEPLGRDGFLPIRIEGGTLHGGSARIRGDVSSQFLSALMLMSPLVTGGIQIEIEGPVSSAAYLALTRTVLDAFGGLPGGGYRPTRFPVPGDDSAACFLIAGTIVSSGRIRILGLSRRSEQPDAVFRDWAGRTGGRISWEGDDENTALTIDARQIAGPSGIRPLSVDVDAAPDAALPLAALLAFAGGTSVLAGAARLREKESDRLAAALDLLERSGAVARAEGEGREVRLVIDGRNGTPHTAHFAAHGDHRVAMSAAVLALALPPGSNLDDPAAVGKSYPEFFRDFESLLRHA